MYLPLYVTIFVLLFLAWRGFSRHPENIGRALAFAIILGFLGIVLFQCLMQRHLIPQDFVSIADMRYREMYEWIKNAWTGR